ncbi:hypothetical protein ACUXCC_000982 [Cytobacillus horneckiae]
MNILYAIVIIILLLSVVFTLIMLTGKSDDHFN